MKRNHTHFPERPGLLLFVMLFATIAFNTVAHSKLFPAYPTVNITTTDVSCNGGSDGTATAVISPGSVASTYTLTWSDGTTAMSRNGLPAGVYSVTVVENATGYTFTDAATVNEPGLITSSTTITNVDCYGNSTGAIALSLNGGNLPYNITWEDASSNTVSNSANVSGLSAGLYTLDVVDAKGCTHSRTVSVNEPAAALGRFISSTNVSCKFGSDASVDLSVWGGTPPYTYNWNSGTYFTQDLSNIPAGNYSVTVTDKNNCTTSGNVVITEPAALSLSTIKQDVDCNGNSTGSIDLTVSGGSPDYTYAWTNSQYTLANTEDLSNLPADIYSLTLTDKKGCTASTTVSISEPPVLTVSESLVNASCYGNTDGEIDLTLTGGSPPYSFAWSNSQGPLTQTSEDLLNIPAETYTVVITDSRGCSVTKSYTILQPLAPLNMTFTKTDILCFGDNTGDIDISVSGGTPGYSYSWSNGATSQDVQNLFAGTYQILIVDTNSCQHSKTITITQPSAALTIVPQITDVKCNGDSTGSVVLNVSGGTTPYTFNWKNSQVQLSTPAQSLLSYPAETYMLYLHDKNNCELRDTFTITEPPTLSTSVSGTDVNCYGDLTGMADLTVIGGTTPYTYLWNNSSVTEDLQNLPSGMYTVTVTDSQNCTTSDSVFIDQPDTSLYSSWTKRKVLCHDGEDGAINYKLRGGTFPYIFQWSSGQKTEDLDSIPAGWYIITSTDQLGCQLTDSIEVLQPDELQVIDSIVPVSCYGEESGSIYIKIEGGNFPYEFLWKNSDYVLSSIDKNLLDAYSDTYTIKVTDTLGCTGSKTIFLPEPDSLELSFTKKDVVCFDGSDGEIDATATGGVTPYSFLWSDGGVSEDRTGLKAGTHSVTVSDSNGCQTTDSIELTQPDSILILTDIFMVTCVDQQDGKIDLNVSGGNGGYDFLWSDGSTTMNVENLEGGSYSVTVTDVMGCTRTAAAEIPVKDLDCLNIPSAFTPNGDGMNDTWILRNMDLYPEASVQVFNQWGAQLYETKGQYIPWNGAFRGKEVPAATYYYVITLRPDYPSYSGPVTIVR